jgi:thioredoxin 1
MAMRFVLVALAALAALASADCGNTPTSPSSAVVELGSNDFNQLVLAHSGTAMVEFFLPTCPHCQAMVATVEQLAQAYAGRALVGRVDASNEPGLIQTYQVSGVPTFVFFKNGHEVSRRVGEDSYADLAAMLDSTIAAP